MVMTVFADRFDAGRQLAARLEYLHDQDVVVLGLPRGGVPVAFEVAEALGAPLDVIVVRKLGVPFQPELAMGAIGEGGAEVLDANVMARARITDADLSAVESRERALLEERVARLRRGRDRIDLLGRTAVIVDDGIATGSTARVACQVARHLGAARVIMAAPVAPEETVRNLTEADEVVCVSVPRWFMAVGQHYRDFSTTSDDEVILLLDHAARRMRGDQSVGQRPDCDVDVEIPVGAVVLQGHLHLPEPADSVVLFTHEAAAAAIARATSPSPLRSTEQVSARCCSTCSLRQRSSNVFDMDLFATRLTAATRWLRSRSDSASCRVEYFGASTGAGAALLAVVDRATHLFEEPGTLAEAAILASDWFTRYLAKEPQNPSVA